MRTIGQFLTSWTSMLKLQGIDSPRLSAEVITARALDMRRLELILSRDRSLSPDEAEKTETFLRRREKGEPLAYILGQKEFYGQDFRVSEKVLIPRPETELVLETAKELFSRQNPFLFADICTGSGNIGIMFAKLFPESRGMLLDFSVAALEVARHNIEEHDLCHRLWPVCSDLVAALCRESLGLLLANPPYVPESKMPALSREIREYEPHLALNGGLSGLEAILVLLEQGNKILKQGGWLIMEIGVGQYAQLRDQSRGFDGPWDVIRTYRDLSGRDRVLALQKAVA